MKKSGRKDLLLLLLMGLAVLLVPLIFFNNLLANALEKSRETSLEYLREDILQVVEEVRNSMKPVNYVKQTIKQVHAEVLPEVTQNIVEFLPDKDFGRDLFSKALPEKLLKALRRHHLDAIQIVTNPPEFSDAFYWNCPELVRQCPVEDKLALDHSLNNFYSAGKLYLQHFQRPWKSPAGDSPYLTRFQQIIKNDYLFAYLSRISQLSSAHDHVDEVFTDYFGQQSLFCYTYICVSEANLHGAYNIVVPQKSIQPGEIIKSALKKSRPGMKVSLDSSADPLQGFKELPAGLEFYARLPSEFWNHHLFLSNIKNREDDWRIRISGKLPDSFVAQLKNFQIFRLIAAFSLMGYLTFAFRLWLNGIVSCMTIRLRLSLLLGLIVFLPLAGTGIMTSTALRASDSVVENRVLQYTLNSVRELAILNDENHLRRMIAVLEVKRLLSAGNCLEIASQTVLSIPGLSPDWYLTWTSALNICLTSGLNLQFDPLEPVPPSRLIVSLLNKYMESLGLEEMKRSNSGSVARGMTMGLLENYMTPEMEEAWMVHESTIQRELTQGADTVNAALFLVRDKKANYHLIYHRVNTDATSYDYLTWYSNNLPEWFARKDAYADLSLAVTIRRGNRPSMYAWPPGSLVIDDFSQIFERSLASRDSGLVVVRNGGNFSVKTWRYKEGESAIIAGISKSRGFAMINYATSMLMPLLLGYACLVLYFVTQITASFIREPVRIIGLGVAALKEGRYGVRIANFTGNEFKQVTRAFNEMSNALRQRELIKRYVSEKLFSQVRSGRTSGDSPTGELVKVSVLAADIRGFTSISERNSPADIVDMLNSYFTYMEKAITAQGGIIDKYIGDAVQAVFYADPTMENAAIRACRAATGMRRMLILFNQERTDLGLFTIENGIGVDTGMVISGSIGSKGRKDYTVVGNIVEQAASLEALTVNCNSRILLSLTTQAEAGIAVKTRPFNDSAVELIDA